MDAIPILNHYRISLLENQQAFHLLAHLLRDGPQSPADIASRLNIELHEANRCLNTLFRASLLRRQDTGIWNITELAEQILQRLKVYDIAIEDLAAQHIEDEQLISLVRAWVHHHADKPEHSSTFLNSLRCIDQIENLDPRPDSGEHQRKMVLTLSALIGSDPLVLQPSERESKIVWRYPVLLFVPTEESQHQHQNLKKYWDISVRTYITSNDLFVRVPSDPMSMVADSVTIETTWIRAFNAALQGKVDVGLKLSCDHWERKDASTFWLNVFSHVRLARVTRSLFERWTGLAVLSEEWLRDRLAENFWSVLGKSRIHQTAANAFEVPPRGALKDLID